MNERHLRAAIGFLALVGSAIAAYILYARYAHQSLACSSGGCEVVQRSAYAELLGVPVALLGLLAYLTVFVTALSAQDVARALGVAISLAGVAFGAYLLYVQVGVIESICEWCLASDAVMTGLAALALLRMRAATRAGVRM